MREKIDCFLPCDDLSVAERTVSQLRNSKTVQNIFLLVSEVGECISDCRQLCVSNLTGSNTLMSIAENAKADYALLVTKGTRLTLGQHSLD